MPGEISLARYLFTRLRQLGVQSIHGVPGDFTLRALDHVRPAGLKWIGNSSELGAGYAADGYARVKGLGALFTTYGVGELSAMNAVAGSFAEHIPVVHIVGTPARRLQRSGGILHHSLGNGDNSAFAEMAARITQAQVDLREDPEFATDKVDSTLQHCITHSKPVYLQLPSDMADSQVSASPLEVELRPRPVLWPYDYTQGLIREIVRRLRKARQPLILVDGLTARYDLNEDIQELAKLTNIPIMALTFGKGAVDESLPNWRGIHTGVDSYANNADMVFLFGPLLSDTNTAGWSAVPRGQRTIMFNHSSVGMPSAVGLDECNANIRLVLQELTKSLQYINYSFQEADVIPAIEKRRAVPQTGPITQDAFWTHISSFLRPYDTVLLANGTPLIGFRDTVLPPQTKVISSGLWLSIGHMLPAAQGAALAMRDSGALGRTILFEGDGSFQVTCQALSDIIRYKLDVTIFIINNAGYTFERWVHGMEAEYNDVAPWRYLEAPSFFGAPADGSYPVETRRVATWEELVQVLADGSITDGKGLKLVEVVMGMYDVPEKSKTGLRKAGQQLASS